MQIDNIYSSELYDLAYANCKYFNQRPWDVAMNKKLAEEFKYLKECLNQDVINGKKDANQYFVMLKMVLDGPMFTFEQKGENNLNGN